MGQICENDCQQSPYEGYSEASILMSIYTKYECHEIPCEVNHLVTRMIFQQLQQPQYAQHGISREQGYYYIPDYKLYYDGQWLNNQPHGLGQIVFEDGNVLRAWFKNGVVNGPQCIYFMKNYSYYRGAILKNKFNGQGKLIIENQQGVIIHSYQGQWVNNKPEGLGVQIYQNGDKYIGKFVDGIKEDVLAKYLFANENKYTMYQGGFKKGMFAGKGVLTDKDDNTISGMFQNNNINFVQFNGSKFKYTGMLSQGKLHGKCKIIEIGKSSYQGNFDHGVPHGNGVITDEQNRKFETYLFKSKKLKEVKGITNDEVQFLIDEIEKNYASFKTHDAALQKLNKNLIQWNCQLTDQLALDRSQEKQFLAIQIADRIIKISKNSNQI